MRERGKRQTEKQTDRRTDRQADKNTDRHKQKEIHSRQTDGIIVEKIKKIFGEIVKKYSF